MFVVCGVLIGCFVGCVIGALATVAVVVGIVISVGTAGILFCGGDCCVLAVLYSDCGGSVLLGVGAFTKRATRSSLRDGGLVVKSLV